MPDAQDSNIRVYFGDLYYSRALFLGSDSYFY